MAAIVQAQAGNWSDTATWQGGTVPGDSDSVTMNANLTVDVDVTVGTDPATGGTPAIDVSSAVNGKTLTIAAGKTLRCKGDLKIEGSYGAFNTLQLGAGASVILDPKDASTQYFVECAAFSTRVICNGTANARCTIETDLTRASGNLAAKGAIKLDAGNRGLQTATYTDFINLGTSAIAGVKTIDLTLPSVTHCTFQDASFVASTGNATSLTFTDNNFSDSTGFTDGGVLWAAILGYPTFTVDRNSFDRRVLAGVITPASTVQNNYFHRTLYTVAQSGTLTGTEVTGNFFATLNLGGSDELPPTLPSKSSGNYFVHYGLADKNATGSETLANNPRVHDGNIFDWPDGDASPDCYAGGANETIVVKNCISIANFAGTGGAGLLSLNGGGGSSNIDITMEHNTLVGVSCEGGILKTDENQASKAGTIHSVKSNLVICPYPSSDSRNTAYFVRSIIASEEDAIVSGGADNNGSWHGKAGAVQVGVTPHTTIGYGNAGHPDYLPMSSGAYAALGTHDVIVTSNPVVDSTRCLAKWGQRRQATGDGTASSVPAVLAVLQADPTKIADLITWVNAGYAPKTKALKAAHDTVNGGWIGAVPGVLTSPYGAYAGFQED